MVENSSNRYSVQFPRQKISYKKKISNKKEWFKQCIDSAEKMAIYENGERHRKMSVLYDLDNDIINEEEMEAVFNPMGLDSASFPASTKNYPLSVPKLDLLQGEELKRRFSWTVRSKNPGVETSRVDTESDMMMQMLMQELQAESFNEEDFQKKFDKLAKYMKYNWKDKHELTATRILQYLWREQDLQEKFNTAFRDVMVSGMEVYRVDTEGEEPVAVRVDPLNFYPMMMGNSSRIEDADIAVEITYEPINKIIDTFYDFLTESEVEEIEGYCATRKSDSRGVLGYKNEHPPIYSNLDFGNGPGFSDISEAPSNATEVGLPYDEHGNIRVVRVRWVGRKRIGILKFINQNTGEEEERPVSEFYKPREELGESIRYIWINETYEGAKIGEVYTKMQRKDVQMRHLDNKSKCALGYVGTVYGKSLMARMEPYQYLYNVYMRRLEMIMAKYKGPIYELDISKIPDDWEMDKWMYYSDVLGWAVIDNFNEAKKGAATGKLAGSFNTGGRVLDPNIGNYIQQIIMMLQHIEDIMGKIAGVTEQRLGQVENRETVGGVERAVTQSSHITEKWFFLHDETKKRVLSNLLDVAKFTWRKESSKKLNFVMDDMSRAFLEFSPEDIESMEYDLFITNSSRDQEIRQNLIQMSHAHMQNGGDMSTIVDVFMSESISDMRVRLDTANQEIREREEKMQQQQQQTQQQIAQMQQQEAQADRQLEYDKLANDKYKAELDAEVKLTIADKSNESVDTDDDSDKVDLEKTKHNDKMNLEKSKLSELIRSNKAKETISRMKPKSQSSK